MKRKRKQASTAATRRLQAEWEALLASHSKPLERGAKAKGVKSKPVKSSTLKPQVATVREIDNSGLIIRSKSGSGAATKVTLDADMQSAIRRVASRVGMAYNKGGLQLLTDDELKEQTTGAHKRR